MSGNGYFLHAMKAAHDFAGALARAEGIAVIVLAGALVALALERFAMP